MKTPESLESLVDLGIVQEVVRPLMSGKEAQIYVVVAGGDECVAKVYKEATQRTFKHRAEYTEGRRTLNSRDQRAMSKRSRYGRKQDEAAWRSTEVDMIFRLREAGVRVPEPINFVDGVLVMELVKDADGDPAPRLGDLSFEASEASEIYRGLLREVVRMLCAGVIHGDLSEFNVLMGADGPVLIDFPQSVDPARNQGARKLLSRDVENLHRFVERFAPRHPRQRYAEEMWSLYEANRLAPDTELRGDYRAPEGKADTEEVMALIEDANRDEQARRDARGVETPVGMPKPLRAVVDFTKETKPKSKARSSRDGSGPRPKTPRTRTPKKPVSASAPVAPVEDDGAAPKKRRRRRSRKRKNTVSGEAPVGASSRETTPSAQKGTSSGRAEGSKGRGRNPRAGDDAKSGGTRMRANRNTKGPTRPGGDSRGGSGATPAAGATDRPPRRRRRRSRRKPSGGSDAR